MTVNKKQFHELPPLVSIEILILISGIMWTLVGIMLMNLARGWLSVLQMPDISYYYISGLLLASLVYKFMFNFVANKNIVRIYSLPKKVNVLLFQEFKSYFLIIFMISLGVILRKSGFPKTLLAIGYLGIGGGLFFGSTNYYRKLRSN